MLRYARTPIGGLPLLAMFGVSVIALFLGLFFSALSGLLFSAAAWVALATWRYPWPAFLLLIAVAPFLLILKATVVLGPITLLKDIVILTLFVRSLRGDGVFLSAPLRVPIIALLVWNMIAFLRADAFALGVLRLRDLLLYVLLLPIAARLVQTPERRRTFFTVFLGTAALVLALGVFQWFLFPDSMVLRFDAARQIWIPRVASVLAHPNHLGGYLVFVVALAAGIAWTRGCAWRARISAGALICASVVAAYFTYSRSAWIAVPLALGSTVLIAGAHRAFRAVGAIVLLLLLAAGVAFAIPATRDYIRAVANPAYQSNRTRLDIFAGSLSEVSNVGVLIGEGLGDTATVLQRTADISVHDIVAGEVREAQIAKARTFVDNGVVKTWVEQGTVGLVIVGWIAVRLLHLGFRTFRAGIAESRAIGMAMGVLVCGLFALWFLLDVPDMFPANLYFWVFAGLLTAAEVSNSKSQIPNKLQ
ncbi:MAG: hypothetical protein G01um1014106_412 [Parcubacteria group bacterium Gr01-1014_106]|nr:MAG: hypothetical protein G01um1014106_412 [Parcubacteria group bacterium Gr01-1014_106]